MNAPQFLIAGSARCGTTSLYYYLSQHPGLCMPRKETFYFARSYYERLPPGIPPIRRDASQLIVDERAYDNLFGPCGQKTAGECSTCYGYLHETAIPLIRKKLGDVKIIFLLRDPVDRAWSGYRHFVRLGYESLSFEEAIASEESRIARGWDFMWHYTRLGYYAEQVNAFKSSFSEVLIVCSEEFFENPRESMRNIFEFIGADASFVPRTGRRYNFSHEDRESLRYRFVHHPVTGLSVKPLARMVLTRKRRLALRERLRLPSTAPPPKPGADTAARLEAMYHGDVMRLRAITRMDFPYWKT